MKKWTWFLSVFVVFMSTADAVEKKVQVETPVGYKKNSKGVYIPENHSYLQRRPKWGVRLNFLSNIITLAQDEKNIESALIYERDGLPFEIDFGVHRSFDKFSVGAEIGYLSSKFENMTNSISTTGVFAGLGFYADGIFKTPYFVPFAFAGLASISGDLEGPSVGGTDSEGNSINERDIQTESIVPYYKVGFLVGLNWIERGVATKALSDYSLQNTFLYFAVKKITDASTREEAIKLETNFYGEFGFQLEF